MLHIGMHARNGEPNGSHDRVLHWRKRGGWGGRVRRGEGFKP